jgi:tetratricopeptide (TPR) repeat protein
VAFSPDGRSILTGCYDKTARLWDATGRPLGAPVVHPGEVASVAFSPDGRTILTDCHDNMAWLWDAATGQPIGPPMPLPSSGGLLEMLPPAVFSPDGRSLLTSDFRRTRLWDMPAPLPDDLPRLAAWVEAATGLELDERGSVRVLDRDAWLERRRRLDSLGGPPPADPAPRLDPILYGDEPAARGGAWKERGDWDRAEAAFAEAIRARPLNGAVASALARLHLERGRPGRAAATLAEAVARMPDDLILRRELGEALLWEGDRSGWRRSIAAVIDDFGGTKNVRYAYRAARACVLGPEGPADPAVPVRLATTAVRGATAAEAKSAYLGVLGASLYRAGRYDEAIRRLEEAIEAGGGVNEPADRAFLAMAHHRLDHHDEARRWLDRLRQHQPSTAPAQFWDELEIRLLRSEAEAVVLYDPVVPEDPFAR